MTSVAKARKQRTTARQMEDLPLAPDTEDSGAKGADDQRLEEKRAPCATRCRKRPGTPA